MDSNLLNEVKRYKEILKLSEQEVVNEEIYNGNKPSDDNFVKHGKSMTNFKYSN